MTDRLKDFASLIVAIGLALVSLVVNPRAVIVVRSRKPEDVSFPTGFAKTVAEIYRDDRR